MTIKIVLYEDNDLLRESLITILQDEPDFTIIAAEPNALTVAKDILNYNPDVVLMDIDMPYVNGVEAVATIRSTNQKLPILMLTVFDDNQNIFNALYAGATGYLLKKQAADELPTAIRYVMQGGAPMTASVAKQMLTLLPPTTKTLAQHGYELSKREVEVLQYMIKGLSYKGIAAEMYISLETVRTHIRNMYDKLHVHSARAAIAIALQHNLAK